MAVTQESIVRASNSPQRAAACERAIRGSMAIPRQYQNKGEGADEPRNHVDIHTTRECDQSVLSNVYYMSSWYSLAFVVWALAFVAWLPSPITAQLVCVVNVIFRRSLRGRTSCHPVSGFPIGELRN